MVINRKLMLEVADKIEADPQLYYQGCFASGSWLLDGGGVWRDYSLDPTQVPGYVRESAVFCGTAFCIAGWALHLNGYAPNDGDDAVWWSSADGQRVNVSPWEEGKALLGLDGESEFIFEATWQPRPELSVPEALRALAEGASYKEVTHRDCF